MALKTTMFNMSMMELEAAVDREPVLRAVLEGLVSDFSCQKSESEEGCGDCLFCRAEWIVNQPK